MRIVLRTSRWALLARRLGSVAVPLVFISVMLHRMRLITGDVFAVAAVVAGVVSLLAVLSGIVALRSLWQSGDQGWSHAFAGLFLGLVCLIPFGWYANLARLYPPVTDIATTDRALLPLVFEPGTQAMPPPRLLSPQAMAETFPDVATRTYPLGVSPTFALVEALARENGWDIRLLRQPGSFGQINGQVMTPPGWREEAVVRVTGTAETASVDMRSASLHATHDFGSNGQRIETFLSALDDAVTALLRDNPAANQPIEPEPEPVPEAEPPTQ